MSENEVRHALFTPLPKSKVSEGMAHWMHAPLTVQAAGTVKKGPQAGQTMWSLAPMEAPMPVEWVAECDLMFVTAAVAAADQRSAEFVQAWREQGEA